MIALYTVLGVLVTFSFCSGQPRIVYFHPEVNNEPKKCPEKESDVRLICKTNGTVSRIIIKRERDQKLLYTSPGASTSAEFLIEHVECVDMGVYQCIIDDIHMETTALVLYECSPLPCHQEGTTMSVEAEVNKPLDISLCVLVYTGILNYTIINTVNVRRKASSNYTWNWDYYENKVSACFRNVTIVLNSRNLTAEDYEGVSVRVCSSAGDTLYLDYNISVIPSGSPLVIATNARKDNQAQEDNEVQEDIITFLPPFLVIAGAVVLTIVMIVRKEKMNKQKQQTM